MPATFGSIFRNRYNYMMEQFRLVQQLWRSVCVLRMDVSVSESYSVMICLSNFQRFSFHFFESL